MDKPLKFTVLYLGPLKDWYVIPTECDESCVNVARYKEFFQDKNTRSPAITNN